MTRSAPPERLFALGLAGIALVTLWRVALLPFDRADLFTDDAQYWLWGWEPALGLLFQAAADRLDPAGLDRDRRRWRLLIRLPLPCSMRSRLPRGADRPQAL